MIIRRVRNRDYTVVANAIFRDGVLSFEAMGLAAYLLSKPDHWKVDLKHLAKVGKVGRDKMRRVAGELIAAHFLTRSPPRRDPETGEFEGVEYVLHDEPVVPDGDTVTSSPQTENPAPVNPAPENPSPVVSTDSEQILNRSLSGAGAREGGERESEGAIDEGREEARSGEAATGKEEQPDAEARKRWRKMRADYPHAGLDDLPKAEKLFMASTDADQVAMVASLPRWAAYLATQRIRPHLQNFIADRRWELIPEVASAPEAKPPAAPAAEGYTVVKPFGLDFWSVWHRRPDDPRKTFNPGFLADQARQNRSLTLRQSDMPTDADRAALTVVFVDSDQWRAWSNHFAAAGIRLPKPDQAERAWMPAEWPPGHAPNQPTLCEIDEAMP